MSLPGGYSRTTMVQVYGGTPAPYQMDFYIASSAVNASTNQKALVISFRNAHKGGWLRAEELEALLTNNS